MIESAWSFVAVALALVAASTAISMASSAWMSSF